MAQPHEPKKETVRILLPPADGANLPGAGGDTVRIQSPSSAIDVEQLKVRREETLPSPVGPSIFRPPPFPPPAARVAHAQPLDDAISPRQPAKTPARPANLPPPPVINTGPSARPAPPPTPAAFGIYPGASPVSSRPKQDTARISLIPGLPPTSATGVNMKKTQPLRTSLPPVIGAAPMPAVVTRTQVVETIGDSIPRSLCWALLAVSAVTFLIQIWHYFVV